MIPREPAKTSAEPKCFAVRFRSADATCRVCPHRINCAPACRTWGPSLAYAEHAAAAPAANPNATPLEVYKVVFQAVFNRKAPCMYIQKNAVACANAVCEAKGYDLTDWLHAQLEALNYATQGRGLPSPATLHGPKCEQRYLKWKQSRTALNVTGEVRAFQAEARAVDSVAMDVEEFIRLVYLDDYSGPLEDHEAYSTLPLAARRAIQHPDVDRNRPIVLRAASEFINTLRHGFDRHIAMPSSWDWTQFFAFIRFHFPLPVPAVSVLPAHLGGVSLG
jgi:hypothetical protein